MAERFYIGNELQGVGQVIELPSPEALHLTRVMRAQAGDRFRVFGNGREFDAVLVKADRKHAAVRLDAEVAPLQLPSIYLTFIFPWLKGDRNELIVQKLTEIGVSRMVLFNAFREVAHGSDTRLGRLERTAIEACKQCGRADIPQVISAGDIVDALANARGPCLICHEQERRLSLSAAVAGMDSLSAATIATGPEGGFTPDEITSCSHLARTVSLGRRVLRAETAPIVAASILMAAAGEM